MVREFRQFLFRGNLIDLAVAIVIGTAFGLLVAAFVADIITPIVAAIFGSPDFSGLTFTINDSVFRYGDFLNALITFVSVAAAVFFFVVKPMNAALRAPRQARRGRGCDARVPRVPEHDSRRRPPLLGLHRSGTAGQLTQTVVGSDHGDARPTKSTAWNMIVPDAVMSTFPTWVGVFFTAP